MMNICKKLVYSIASATIIMFSTAGLAEAASFNSEEAGAFSTFEIYNFSHTLLSDTAFTSTSTLTFAQSATDGESIAFADSFGDAFADSLLLDTFTDSDTFSFAQAFPGGEANAEADADANAFADPLSAWTDAESSAFAQSSPYGEANAFADGFADVFSGTGYGFNGAITTYSYSEISTIGNDSIAGSLAESVGLGEFYVAAGETFSFDYEGWIGVYQTEENSIAQAELSFALLSLDDNTVIEEFTLSDVAFGGTSSRINDASDRFSRLFSEDTSVGLVVQTNTNVEEVPEPLTILASLTALGAMPVLKKEYSKRR